MLTASVGIPQFRGGIDIHDAVITAPLQDLEGVDIPSQVDQQIAWTDMLGEQRAHIVFGDAIAHEAHAFRRPRL